MKVVGIRRIDIDRDGSSIHGYKYFCTEPVDGVAGLSVDSFFATDRLLSSLPRDISLDDEVIPVYRKESRQLRTIIFDND